MIFYVGKNGVFCTGKSFQQFVGPKTVSLKGLTVCHIVVHELQLWPKVPNNLFQTPFPQTSQYVLPSVNNMGINASP